MLFRFTVILFLFLAPLPAVSQTGGPAEWQKQAQTAIEDARWEQAERLYRKLLKYNRNKRNTLGEVDCLENLAFIYKQQRKYTRARITCLKALRSGAATPQSYLLLAQISFEHERRIKQALDYCEEGLKRFPHNSDLQYFRRLLKDRELIGEKNSSAPVRKTQHNASVVADTEINERAVLQEMNRARTTPRAYARELEKLIPYFAGDLLKLPGKVPVRTVEGLTAVKEAIDFLKKVNPVGALIYSEGLSRAARDHVKDQGKSGETGHIGSDGSEPYQRMERYGNWLAVSGENIAYGDDSAKMIIIQLLIDDGVPSRGHRKNIFNPNYRVAGAAIGPHPLYGNMCVITYAGGFVEKP